MKKLRSKYRLMTLAFFISLMHGFIPHTHGEVGHTGVVITDQNCDHSLSLFTCILTFDLGEDHLEHYLGSGEHDLTDVNVAGLINTLLHLEASDTNSSKLHFDILKQPVYPGFCISLVSRGPPAV